MFTGIITDLGEVRAISRGGDTRFEIATRYQPSELSIGSSICCSGVCLTVVDRGRCDDGRGWFAVTVSAETMACTTLGGWQVGSPVNIERSLRLGDELGGHIVSGHVDGVGEITSIHAEGDSRHFVFTAPEMLARFIARKGSIAVDGVSLTVNATNGRRFDVNVIPHTLQWTTFGGAKPGDPVNLEIDMLARYVARLLDRE
jgi:riboflavin synthase